MQSSYKAETHWSASQIRILWRLAGLEPVRKISQRIGRSERAVRCRLAAANASAKLKEGSSLRQLQSILHVSRRKLRRWIADGSPHVRDPRISHASLILLLPNSPDTIQRGNPQVDGYSRTQAANILNVTLQQIRALLAKGRLKVIDPFVTERSLRSFFKSRAGELNWTLMDSSTVDRLTEKYRIKTRPLKASAIRGQTSRATGMCQNLLNGCVRKNDYCGMKQLTLNGKSTYCVPSAGVG
jgi:hypothetical protein